jgi:GxxExxY protein
MPLLHGHITEQIIGGFHDVYREHGYGYVESIYARSMGVEVQHRGLQVQREVATEVFYKGVSVGLYRADMIVEGKVLVEMKAQPQLTDSDERQILNYLKATKLEVGLLFNFGPKPQFRRLILSRRNELPAGSVNSVGSA